MTKATKRELVRLCQELQAILRDDNLPLAESIADTLASRVREARRVEAEKIPE